jgi:membrane fusion protein (multidrug efflux system)
MDDPHPVPFRDHAASCDDDASSSQYAADHRPAHRPFWRRPFGIALGLVLAIALIGAGILYWLHARHFETTDDAFIDGYVTQMAPRVAGQVTELLVTDNQHVTAGQTLLRIDPRDYQVKLDQARAQRASDVAGLQQAKAQLVMQQANLEQAQANVRVAEADFEQAQKNYGRYTSIRPGAVSRQEVDSATATFGSDQAKLDAARQAVEGARAQLQATQAQVASAEMQVRQADANVESAGLRLSYCTIVAPVAGRTGHRSVDVGNYVNPG